jgi:predicted N-formylglutamate amidohydrolase
MPAVDAPPPLLAADEPPPFDCEPGTESPYLVLCDHAGRRIPRRLGTLGVAESELERHIAWDIGAAGTARVLAARLGAFLILQTYSRLVIDCNRPLTSPSSIVERSENTDIPGNRGLSSEAARSRAEAIFEPYHARIREELARRAARAQKSVLIFVHSFTPVFKGVARPWHVGILYHREARLGRALLSLLKRDATLVVGDNEPYAADPNGDFGLIQHAEARSLPCVELEIRQDLIADERGQALWGEKFARWIVEASAVFQD